ARPPATDGRRWSPLPAQRPAAPWTSRMEHAADRKSGDDVVQPRCFCNSINDEFELPCTPRGRHDKESERRFGGNRWVDTETFAFISARRSFDAFRHPTPTVLGGADLRGKAGAKATRSEHLAESL